MGATDIYALPWPELPDAANGPEGFGKLAQKVDDQMTRWRADNKNRDDVRVTLATGATATVWSNTYTVVKGWIELDIWVSVFGSPATGCAGATVNAIIGGSVVRSWYLHNDCGGHQPMLIAAGSGGREYTSATPNVLCEVTVANAPDGVAILVGTINVNGRQFGAMT